MVYGFLLYGFALGFILYFYRDRKSPMERTIAHEGRCPRRQRPGGIFSSILAFCGLKNLFQRILFTMICRKQGTLTTWNTKEAMAAIIRLEQKTTLKESGGFRSAECIALLKEADIVAVNPPFSLFCEYAAQRGI
jgi:hypothetical protein